VRATGAKVRVHETWALLDTGCRAPGACLTGKRRRPSVGEGSVRVRGSLYRDSLGLAGSETTIGIKGSQESVKCADPFSYWPYC